MSDKDLRFVVETLKGIDRVLVEHNYCERSMAREQIKAALQTLSKMKESSPPKEISIDLTSEDKNGFFIAARTSDGYLNHDAHYVLKDEQREQVLDYILQSDAAIGEPRIIDVAYAAFNIAKGENPNGEQSDWFNDARPYILRMINQFRTNLGLE